MVRSPDAAAEWHLGGAWTATPASALVWMRGQARRLAEALDPEPGSGPYPRACLRPADAAGWSPGRTFREWVEDADYQSVQLSALTKGRPISVNTRGPDRICGAGDVEVFYSLSARRVHRHAPARRLLRAL
ncbi:hypothetical protein [Streptomyces otsuchiensis]|uniref:hypothetical protein n=1 Tax=Streptomyces otsuchiensis TaxID=2681388 RepID=UPI00103066CA|nr:hypothetical protein [Streptomyces otsuchiensis]